MHRYPPPSLHDSLLPVIACLPTAFFSPKPPPALLPLLSPILRQRISLLSLTPQSTTSSSRPTWLNSLTWSPEKAARLAEIVSSLQLEPHPVSGELELFEDDEPHIQYRRLDTETLQARCDIPAHEIAVIWTWCVNDIDPDTSKPSDGWRVSEVHPSEHENDQDMDFAWYPSQGEAEAAFTAPVYDDELTPPTSSSASQPPTITTTMQDTEDDDDYWASYDRTPAQTPANGPATRASPNHSSTNGPGPLDRKPSTDDDSAYYARYGSEVQPALDSHDPDEEVPDVQSTLHPASPQRVAAGGILSHGSRSTDEAYSSPGSPPTARQSKDFSTIQTIASNNSTTTQTIHSPKPSRPSSPSAAHLEHAAATVSAAEIGVRQHVSSEVKSLYRLSRAAGIEREEFERLIRRELEVLGMMDYE